MNTTEHTPTTSQDTAQPSDIPSQSGQEYFSIWRRMLWLSLYLLFLLWFKLCYRYKVHGNENLPRDGATLILSSHQSFYDPIILGISTRNRPFYALARRTLWNSKLLGKLIDWLNAIPLDQDATDIRALRKGIEVLKKHHALVLYPEGARSPDGKVHAFGPGMLLLVRRAKPVIVPAAIEGAVDVWHRDWKRPRLFGHINMMYGKPLTSEEVLAKENPLEFLQQTIEGMRVELREKMGLDEK